MCDENEEKKNNVYEINIEQKQKPIETLKDNIKKENISDIKIRNQSMQNNTNSLSKSFESDKNDNKEKELINNIYDKNNIRNSRFKRKKEEIKMLIYGNKDKYLNKQIKDGLIQRANRMPELEPQIKDNFNNTLKKIKNKSMEKKAKDILNSDKKEILHEQDKNSKFIKKLKEIEVKIEKINSFKNKTKKENEEKKIEYKFDEEKADNNKENYNKNNFINFNFNVDKPTGSSENKYQELKKLYFCNNKFDFTSLKKKSMKNKTNNKENYNKIKNYSNNYKKKEEFKGKYINYNIQKLNKKNPNPNMIRIINNNENFKNILDKLDKFEENKIDNIIRKNYIYNSSGNLFNDFNKGSQNRQIKNSDFGLYKSVSIEKPSNLKNMMEDVYGEIKDITDYTLKRNFSHKISNIKANIKYSSLTRKEKKFDLNQNFLMFERKFNKSNDLNFDDLLKFCSKRNIKSFIKNTKFSF